MLPPLDLVGCYQLVLIVHLYSCIYNIQIIQIYTNVNVYNVHCFSCTLCYNIKSGGDKLPIIYKINALQLLKEHGYSTYKLRQDKLLAESTIQKLRNEDPISWENIETLCRLLDCKIEDILEYKKEQT